MAFADPMPLRQRSAGIAGALIIPGALGALLITGLAVKDIIRPPLDPPLIGIEIPLPPPPPPDEVEPDPTASQAKSQVVTPKPPVDVSATRVRIDSTEQLPPPDTTLTTIVLPPVDMGSGLTSAIKPVAAAPLGNPGNWVTSEDYRPSWINRELTGTARFELSISASGRVSACRITRSSGHGVLDEATCKLITRRARFNPASDAAGQPVAGSYTSSIRWYLPD